MSALNATVMAADNFSWDVGGRLSTNASEVVSLGDLESINLGWRNYIRAPIECTAEIANGADFA